MWKASVLGLALICSALANEWDEESTFARTQALTSNPTSTTLRSTRNPAEESTITRTQAVTSNPTSTMLRSTRNPAEESTIARTQAVTSNPTSTMLRSTRNPAEVPVLERFYFIQSLLLENKNETVQEKCVEKSPRVELALYSARQEKDTYLRFWCGDILFWFNCPGNRVCTADDWRHEVKFAESHDEVLFDLSNVVYGAEEATEKVSTFLNITSSGIIDADLLRLNDREHTGTIAWNLRINATTDNIRCPPRPEEANATTTDEGSREDMTVLLLHTVSAINGDYIKCREVWLLNSIMVEIMRFEYEY